MEIGVKPVFRLVILGPFLFALAGCAGEALAFNNAIVGYNKRLEASGKRFGEALAPALQGRTANAAQVKAAYGDMSNTLAQVKKDFSALKIPASASAQNLAKGYEKFLKGQEKTIQEMEQLVKLSQTPGAQFQITNIIQTISRREQMELAELQNLQREFARANNIRLK